MTTKLTLSIDEKIINKAKRLSAQKGVSISKMVETYFTGMNEKEEINPLEIIRQEMKPHLKKIKIPENVNYKDIIRQGRYNDYLKKSASRTRIKKA